MSQDFEAWAKQEAEWREYTRKCHLEGFCEFSGLKFQKCVEAVCDCGIEGASDAEVLAIAGALEAIAREE